jgi:predicted CoA-binding protein
MSEVDVISKLLLSSTSIHILGSGLNDEKPANRAIHDLKDKGWRLVPIHPKDAGATIANIPIRKEIDDGIIPEIVVLFLAPQRALDVVKQFLFRFRGEEFPLIWFQRGAENKDAVSMLEEVGANYVIDDCIVEYILRNTLEKSTKIQSLPWYRQTKDASQDGCSIWSAFSGSEINIELMSEFEWTGDLWDLESSLHIIPRYIRSMLKENQSLEELALSLS